MAYVYRGKIRDVEEEPTPSTAHRKGLFDPDKCGTYLGYRQHTRYKIQACQPCKDAQAAYSRDYYDRIGGRPKPAVPSTRKRGAGRNPKNGSGCGTYNGHAAHRRAGTKACDLCLAALREYKRARAQQPAPKGDGRKRGPSPFDPTRCGTIPGYQQHLVHGIPACLPCRSARAEYSRQYRAAIKAEAA